MKILILIIIFNCFYIYSEERKILVLPFLNESDDTSMNYISEVIPNSFNLMLEGVPEYTSVTYDELIEYMKVNSLGIGDFYNRITLMATAEYFEVNNIVRGEYYEDDSYTPKRLEFSIEYIEIDINEESSEIIYNMKIGGQSGINALDTLDMIVETMLDDFIGVVMEYAYIKVITDLPCELYIDGDLMGVTPIPKKRLNAGKHNIRVYYESDEISGDIFNEEVSLAKNEEKELDLKVLTDIILTSELQCSLYLDDEYLGVTPYQGKLLTGNAYTLKVMYEQEMYSEIVSNTEINTKSGESISKYFSVTGNIEFMVDNPDSPLRAQINELPEQILPYEFTEMPLGTYDIKVYVYDEEHDNKYIFAEESIFLNPGETLPYNFDYIQYVKKPGYCLIPGLAQFYNRQRTKGVIIIVMFAVGVTTVALAPLISNLYEKRVYEPMLNDYNENGVGTREEVEQAERNVGIIFYTMLISGISTCFSTFLYSLIDGAINMKRLNNLFNPIIIN